MKIKNVDKKLKIDIWKYGTNKVKISIKTKQLLIHVLDSYSWLDIKITLNKSFSVNNQWFIYISDDQDVKRYFEEVNQWLINIGADLEDHR